MTEQLQQKAEDASVDDIEVVNQMTSFKPSSKTILPSRLATIVSYTTSVTSFGLRAGGYLGAAAINGARIGALTSFELGRVLIEEILTRAGNDTLQSTFSERGRFAAEGVLERALSTLHYSITQTSFLISTGFQVGSTSLASSLAISQYLLSALDAVFGDTETSKAVATIISLVRREFKNPETGVSREKVGLGDLVLGICSLAILQRWEAARTEKELTETLVVELVWDMVVINDPGIRIPKSLLDGSQYEEETQEAIPAEHCSASFVSAKGDLDSFDAVQDQQSLASWNSSQGQSGSTFCATREAFQHQLAAQLKPGSSVRLIAESRLTDRIEIEVQGDTEAEIQPPPGFTLLAVNRQSQYDGTSTFIFQRSQRKRRRGSFNVDDFTVDVDNTRGTRSAYHDSSEDIHTGAEAEDHLPPNDDVLDNSTAPHPAASEGNHNSTSAPANINQSELTRSSASPELTQTEGIAANQKRQRRPRTSQKGSLEGGTAPTTTPSQHTDHPNNNHTDLHYAGGDIENSPLRKAMNRSKSVKNLVEFWSRERQRPLRGETHVAEQLNSGMSLASDSTRSTLHVPARNSSYNFAPHSQQAFSSKESTTEREPRPTSSRFHHRKRSSVYSVASAASDTSLMLRPLRFDDYLDNYMASLRRSAFAPGQFPKQNFASNLSRFARFSLASYGSKFLRLTGAVTGATPLPIDNNHLPQHHSFSYYNSLPPSTVLLSSYLYPQAQGLQDNEHTSGLPLVFYVTVDHESKAVILTCRGTLGFEDILTDMTAEYTSITWRSRTFQVHQGVYASAKRLLQSDNQRILTTLQVALEEFEDYGLILCGHSLGGAVAAMLAILLSQKNTTSAGGAARFVTSPYSPHIGSTRLPMNRPIHAYAYGPAACVSPSLQRASRGLVTTVVHRDDIVPYLSLGTLRDLQAIAWAFKVDTNDAKGEVRRRVLASLMGSFRKGSSEAAFPMPFNSSSSVKENSSWLSLSSWWPYATKNQEGEEEDQWAWSALRSLRASLLADKLVPPGDVFLIETSPVLQRDAFVSSMSPGSSESSNKTPNAPDPNSEAQKSKSINARNVEDLKLESQDDDNASPMPQSGSPRRSYKPATRLTFNLVRDVERRFSEVRFSSGMFTDHFPLKYLEVLDDLNRAIGS